MDVDDMGRSRTKHDLMMNTGVSIYHLKVICSTG